MTTQYVNITRFHKETCKLIKLPERHSTCLLITKGSFNGTPLKVVAYVVPTDVTGDELAILRQDHAELLLPGNETVPKVGETLRHFVDRLTDKQRGELEGLPFADVVVKLDELFYMGLVP